MRKITREELKKIKGGSSAFPIYYCNVVDPRQGSVACGTPGHIPVTRCSTLCSQAGYFQSQCRQTPAGPQCCCTR
ncbi:MAG TPA: hypothetical protein VM802_02930 [Chitinophaga sp.]|uniref:hypothetical protein n=1 Tax=Chitinophaga sp. TaxID=1869181 RepID=UPI002CF5B790|nr:hypothetical protein [Chitinophaga sp.]HVI43791.1 hypothetical protein [Chitinophaga sp.]